jgi:hypothetical protein
VRFNGRTQGAANGNGSLAGNGGILTDIVGSLEPAAGRERKPPGLLGMRCGKRADEKAVYKASASPPTRDSNIPFFTPQTPYYSNKMMKATLFTTLLALAATVRSLPTSAHRGAI